MLIVLFQKTLRVLRIFSMQINPIFSSRLEKFHIRSLFKFFSKENFSRGKKYSSIKFDDEPLLKELKSLGKNHRDKSRAAMYIAVCEEIEEGNELLSFLISHTRSLRTDLNPGHWANLWSHVIEYPFLIEKMKLSLNHDKLVNSTSEGLSYIDFGVHEWRVVIQLLLSDNYWLEQFQSLLLEKHTQTFVFQRYIAAHTVLQHYFSKKDSIRVVDCGSCLGVGPTAMMQDSFFSPIEDLTPERIVNNSILKGLSIKESFCVDITDPFDKDNELWIKACSFYPLESVYYEKFSDQLNHLRALLHSHILSGAEGDMIRLATTWKERNFKKVDAIIANTVMYQLTDEQREEFYNNALEILNDKGIVIITDFARKVEDDPTKIEFKEGGWFGGKKYRTFVLIKEGKHFSSPLEVFRFPDARCDQVEIGIDYSFFFH